MLYIEYPLPICLWGYFIIIEVLMKIKISPRGGFVCSVSITKVAFYSGHFLSRFCFISLLHEIQGSIFLTM